MTKMACSITYTVNFYGAVTQIINSFVNEEGQHVELKMIFYIIMTFYLSQWVWIFETTA